MSRKRKEEGEAPVSTGAIPDIGNLRDLIRKELKDGSICLGNESVSSDVLGYIQTGWTLLDTALGGGLPLGRTVELYGKESSGKSTLALQAIAQCQKDGGIPIYIDTERTFSKELAQKLGVDLDRIILAGEVVTLERTFEYIKKMISLSRDRFPDSPILIVWDTLAATPTDGELTGNGQTGGPYRARVIREGMRAVTAQMATAKVCLVVLNHVHETMSQTTWGSGPHTTTSGGMGVKFHASARILLRASTLIRDDNKRALGQEVIAKIEKNKLNPPKGEVGSRLYYGGGFRDEWSIFDYLKENGVITQAGAWATVPTPDGEAKTYPSKFTELLEEKPEIYDHLKELAIKLYDSQIPDYMRPEEEEI